MKPSENLTDLSSLPLETLVGLFPVELMEQIVGQPIKWSVLRTQAEILDWSLSRYNTCVATDGHRRYRNRPSDRNPMHKYYEKYHNTRAFAPNMGYRHNQVVIEGTCNGVVCACIHIASAFPNSLYLNEIELANPNVLAESPMGPDQKYAGMGRGVFLQVLDNLRKIASEHGYDEILAWGADRVRADILTRKGFELDKRDDFFYQTWLQLGLQAPLVMPVGS